MDDQELLHWFKGGQLGWRRRQPQLSGGSRGTPQKECLIRRPETEARLAMPRHDCPSCECEAGTLTAELTAPIRAYSSGNPTVCKAETTAPPGAYGALTIRHDCPTMEALDSRPRGVAQPGSAPEWGSGGRRFKSGHPDHRREAGWSSYPGRHKSHEA